MKNTQLSILALLLLMVFSGCQGQDDRVYPYPFKSAKIEIKLGGGLEGKKVVHIKGDRSVHETHAVTMVEGVEKKIDTLFIESGDELFYIDLNTKQGTRAENPIMKQLKAISEDQRVGFLTRLAVGVDPGLEGELKTVSSREVAGQKCDVYNINDVGDVCVWYGIPLSSSAVMPGLDVKSTTEAIGVQLDIEIPDSVFEIPEGVTLQ